MNVNFENVENARLKITGSENEIEITAQVTLNSNKKVISANGELIKDGIRIGSFNTVGPVGGNNRLGVNFILQDVNTECDIVSTIKNFILEVEAAATTEGFSL